MDDSVEGGVKNDGSGAVIVWPDGEEELKTPAGRYCSSYKAEMIALVSALGNLLDNPRDRDTPIVICTDSMTSLATLREGLTAEVAAWRSLSRLSQQGLRQFHTQ